MAIQHINLDKIQPEPPFIRNARAYCQGCGITLPHCPATGATEWERAVDLALTLAESAGLFKEDMAPPLYDRALASLSLGWQAYESEGTRLDWADALFAALSRAIKINSHGFHAWVKDKLRQEGK